MEENTILAKIPKDTYGTLEATILGIQTVRIQSNPALEIDSSGYFFSNGDRLYA